MSSIDNLKEAFAGESQANRKYLAFAKKADEEGFPNVARLFRAAAEAETVHAHNHLKVLDGVQKTADNLKAAIEGEGFEFKDMYPKFVDLAEKEENAGAVKSFKYALAVEKIHYDLYSDALKGLDSGKDFSNEQVYVCRNCGNTVYGAAPARCPVCGKSEDWFDEIK